MTAARILTNKPSGVVTIAPGATVGEAVDLMSERNIGAVVVSADGCAIAGILSERDIVHGLKRDGASLLDAPVEDVMTTAVEICAPSDAADTLLGRMTALRLRHLPVVDGERKMIGLVSIGDVVKLRLDDLEHEVKDLHSYITNG